MSKDKKYAVWQADFWGPKITYVRAGSHEEAFKILEGRPPEGGRKRGSCFDGKNEPLSRQWECEDTSTFEVTTDEQLNAFYEECTSYIEQDEDMEDDEDLEFSYREEDCPSM